jgi:predicted Zn finger-like uncharacterized protein
MNVTCPDCRTVYRVNPRKIAAGGVRARCARCPATFDVDEPGVSMKTGDLGGLQPITETAFAAVMPEIVPLGAGVERDDNAQAEEDASGVLQPVGSDESGRLADERGDAVATDAESEYLHTPVPEAESWGRAVDETDGHDEIDHGVALGSGDATADEPAVGDEFAGPEPVEPRDISDASSGDAEREDGDYQAAESEQAMHPSPELAEEDESIAAEAYTSYDDATDAETIDQEADQTGGVASDPAGSAHPETSLAEHYEAYEVTASDQGGVGERTDVEPEYRTDSSESEFGTRGGPTAEPPPVAAETVGIAANGGGTPESSSGDAGSATPEHQSEAAGYEAEHEAEGAEPEGEVAPAMAAASLEPVGLDDATLSEEGFSAVPRRTDEEISLPPPPFGASDPHARARRLARALVSDIVVYNPDRRDRSIREGTVRQEFREEIRKSWEEYVAHVGNQMARETAYFRDALNELLAGGSRLF